MARLVETPRRDGWDEELATAVIRPSTTLETEGEELSKTLLSGNRQHQIPWQMAQVAGLERRKINTFISFNQHAFAK